MLTRVLWARVERAKSGESEEKSICVGRSVVSCECVGEEKGSSSGRELRGTDMLLLLLSLLTAITSSNDLVSACNMLACHRRAPPPTKAESYSIVVQADTAWRFCELVGAYGGAMPGRLHQVRCDRTRTAHVARVRST